MKRNLSPSRDASYDERSADEAPPRAAVRRRLNFEASSGAQGNFCIPFFSPLSPPSFNPLTVNCSKYSLYNVCYVIEDLGGDMDEQRSVDSDPHDSDLEFLDDAEIPPDFALYHRPEFRELSSDDEQGEDADADEPPEPVEAAPEPDEAEHGEWSVETQEVRQDEDDDGIPLRGNFSEFRDDRPPYCLICFDYVFRMQLPGFQYDDFFHDFGDCPTVIARVLLHRRQ